MHLLSLYYSLCHSRRFLPFFLWLLPFSDLLLFNSGELATEALVSRIAAFLSIMLLSHPPTLTLSLLQLPFHFRPSSHRVPPSALMFSVADFQHTSSSLCLFPVSKSNPLFPPHQHSSSYLPTLTHPLDSGCSSLFSNVCVSMCVCLSSTVCLLSWAKCSLLQRLE